MSPLTSVRRVLAATAVTAALVVTGACSDADEVLPLVAGLTRLPT